jgi:hypothetical protein
LEAQGSRYTCLIYILKSTGLPIIEKVQASQYALLVEPNMVSIYTVTIAVSHGLLRFPVSKTVFAQSIEINPRKSVGVFSFCIRQIGRKPLNPGGRGDLLGDFRLFHPSPLLQSANFGAPIEEPLLSREVPGYCSNLKHIEVSVAV